MKNYMRPMPVFIVCLLYISCLFGSHQVTETPIDKRFTTYEMKDKGHVVIKNETLVRTYSFTGIMTSGTRSHYYTIFTAMVINPSGSERTYRRIQVYDYDHRDSRISGWLAITDKNFYIRNGESYTKYIGTGTAKFDKAEPDYYRYYETYKWPVRYMWAVVSKEEFELAAEKGELINIQDTGRGGKPEKYSEKKIDDYAFYRRKIPRGSNFLEAVKEGKSETIAELLRENPDLIYLCDDNGKTGLHLAVEARGKWHLYPRAFLEKFGPVINVIDFKGRTPLHSASLYRPEKDVMDRLVRMGGKILYEDCDSEKFGTGHKISNRDLIQHNSPAGWLDNDVYQMWVESSSGFNLEQGAIIYARQRINLELGLHGAPDSDLSRKIGHILDNAHVACRKPDLETKRVDLYLVRLCAPGLRDLVKEYNSQKK